MIKLQFSNMIQNRYTKEEVFELWFKLVEVYSMLDLTNETDRPYAIAGIASRFAAYLRSDLRWGI